MSTDENVPNEEIVIKTDSFVSPRKLIEFPTMKAPKNSTRKGRDKRRRGIITDTPENEAIEARAQEEIKMRREPVRKSKKGKIKELVSSESEK